ncbi:MAG: helix-turn-helix transcriptional regulator [Clostridia bacterium]|nr:helix-turn-helix transcriptional regulator [Clostridia bacterium]
MSVSYNRLWKLMIDKRISKTELTHMAGISTNAMAKLGCDEDVRMAVLEKICSALNCKIEEIVEIQNDDNDVGSIETSSEDK